MQRCPDYSVKVLTENRYGMSKLNTSRRRFLMLAGVGGLGACGVASLFRRGNAPTPTTAGASALQSFNRTSWALGADVSLTVLHADKSVADEALEAAFRELNQLEDVLSIYRPHSQLSRLNRDGVLNHPDARFMAVLNASQQLAERSGGAFDASVQPLWELYFAAQKKNTLPSEAEIAGARAKVDWRKIAYNTDTISFSAPEMKLTFNGIAQGYAADRVLAVLKSHGIEHALIDTGEIDSCGQKADGSAFRAGIQHPRQLDAFVAVCKLDGRALATSGDYATSFSADFLYNHIFNPQTGRSPLELASVSIVAPTGMLADGLTKPVFVLGPERGLALVEATPGCDAFLVTKAGKTISTKGFPLVS
jgi:thiamine biosynthesis lipoprotein